MTTLTPWILSILLIIVVSVASILTLLLSALLLWRYRRAVLRNMAASAGFNQPAPDVPALPPLPIERAPTIDEKVAALTYQLAMRGPRCTVLSYFMAALGFALVFAIAAQFVYSFRLGIPGFLVGVWIYVWPIVPATLIITPLSWRLTLGLIAGYCAIFLLLVIWASTVFDLPATQFGALKLPARSSANPETSTKLWLIVNTAPTLLVLICFNRWVRSVAPLALSIITITVSGMLAAYLALFSSCGVDLAVSVSVALSLHPAWLVLGTMVLSLVVFGAIGWTLARWIAQAYNRNAVSDQSLILDALWLLYAVMYAMWLVLGGVAWLATAPVAFVLYKIVLLWAHWLLMPSAHTAHGLTFLRVFALGRRSERLLDSLSRYWRHIGSVQMITGPDVARSTVQPHQFLDFVSGRLAAHFVRDAGSLAQSVKGWNRKIGKDGRYSINNFFCYSDSWQLALPQLVVEGAVLLDLRSFSQANAGCIHELRYLITKVPLQRCLLLVDDTTDMGFLEDTLSSVWQTLASDSPNRELSPHSVPLHRFVGGEPSVRHLVGRLCKCGAETLEQ